MVILYLNDNKYKCVLKIRYILNSPCYNSTNVVLFSDIVYYLFYYDHIVGLRGYVVHWLTPPMYCHWRTYYFPYNTLNIQYDVHNSIEHGSHLKGFKLCSAMSNIV